MARKKIEKEEEVTAKKTTRVKKTKEKEEKEEKTVVKKGRATRKKKIEDTNEEIIVKKKEEPVVKEEIIVEPKKTIEKKKKRKLNKKAVVLLFIIILILIGILVLCLCKKTQNDESVDNNGNSNITEPKKESKTKYDVFNDKDVISMSYFKSGIVASIGKTKKEIVINNNGKNHTIDFEKNVEDIYIGKIGDNSIILFILEDGTVKYLNTSDVANNQYDINDIKGLNNILKFSTIANKNIDIYAIDINGKTYSVNEYINTEHINDVSSNYIYKFDTNKILEPSYIKNLVYTIWQNYDVVSDLQKTLKVNLTSIGRENKNTVKIVSKEKEIKVTFSKKIVDIYVSSVGRDETGHLVLALMEDGTVEYATLYDVLVNNNNVSNKIVGIKNAVKFYSAYRTEVVSKDVFNTVLVQTTDGSLYDLIEFFAA